MSDVQDPCFGDAKCSHPTPYITMQCHYPGGQGSTKAGSAKAGSAKGLLSQFLWNPVLRVLEAETGKRRGLSRLNLGRQVKAR